MMLRIEAAAIRVGEVVYSLPKPARHHNIIHTLSKAGLGPELIATAEQGFVTNLGYFVSRETALTIARQANQMIRQTAPAYGLFSEDLW